MRELADAARIERFMEALAAAATQATRAYFTGGATAVLLGWRQSTIDVDLKLVPDHDAVLRAIPALKETLRINEERSLFVAQHGQASFYHFDLYAQALAKVERGHTQDLADVREMQARGLIEPARALAYFERIEPWLYRYPAIHGPSFRRAVEETFDA